jgi:hypothetical protein
MNDDERTQRVRSRILGMALAGALAMTAAGPALAVDGVIEINQSRALAGSVTAGDFAGFPVQLNSPGSYRLTSNLNVSANYDGIQVNADDVTLDLNGFTITGGGGLSADGISIASHKNVELRNGTVRGFTRTGVFTNLFTQYVRVIGVTAIGNVIAGIDLQGEGNIIDGCTALNNGSGMRVFDGSLVINSVARGNASFGLSLIGGSGYRSNVLTGNNGGDANPQVSGGLQLGPNVCGTDLVCP